MIPIAVISWRLGNLPSEAFESLILNDDEEKELREDFHRDYSSIFYLQSCQRVVYSVSVSSKEQLDLFINRLYRKLGLIGFPYKPEVFLGIHAIMYLGEVVSGLDAIVIGEEQIQGQVKAAFKRSSPTMNADTRTVFQHLLKIGKRVRENSLLAGGKVSTIELAHKRFSGKFSEVEKIAVLGTGKYALSIIRYLDEHEFDIDVYTTTDGRAGQEIEGHKIKNFKDMGGHEIIITTTNQHKILDQEFVNTYFNQDNVLLLDFGMPRNCHEEVEELDWIKYYDLEELVKVSRLDGEDEVLDSAMIVLEEEVDKMVNKYVKYKRSKVIVALRSDMNSVAEKEKSKFMEENPNIDEKDFDQFVNRLIHVSQQHVEKVLNGD